MITLPEVEMPNFHVHNLRAEWREQSTSDWMLRLSFEVLDVRTGVKSAIMSQVFVHPVRLADSEALKREIHYEVTKMLTHEISEQLFVGGKRVCTTPHPEIGPEPLRRDEIAVKQYCLVETRLSVPTWKGTFMPDDSPTGLSVQEPNR